MPEATTQLEMHPDPVRPPRSVGSDDEAASPDVPQLAAATTERPWERSRTLSAMAALVSTPEVPWRQQPRPDYTSPPEPLHTYAPDEPRTHARIGVLLSSDGAHGPALSEAIHSGNLPGCEIAIVVSNVPGAVGLEAARAAGLPAVAIEGRGREQTDHEQALDALLRRMRVDLICLSGYRRTLSHAFIRRWPGRILTTHPSLLPAFPGGEAIALTLAYGSQITGCTVFSLDESHDGSGPILLQRTLEIADDETPESLKARLLKLESEALIEALRRYTANGWQIRGRRLVRSAPHAEASVDQ